MKAVIIYEDSSTGLRAKCFVDQMANQFQAPTRPALHLWRADLLRVPLFTEQAAIEGSVADIVLFSLHDGGEADELLEEWLNRWIDHKEDRPYAFCVLLDAVVKQQPESPFVERMRKIADQADADLFCGFYETLKLRPSVWRQVLSRAARAEA